jgi:hypothetical protein
MQRDRQFRRHGKWALASDGIQWVLQRHQSRADTSGWEAVSFVHTTRTVLARCMREKGVPAITAMVLTYGLPDDYDSWQAARKASHEGWVDQGATPQPAAV